MSKRSEEHSGCSISHLESMMHLHTQSADQCFRTEAARARALIVYITMVLGQPAGFSLEVCFYTGADWLSC